jgi:hypothetical protein
MFLKAKKLMLSLLIIFQASGLTQKIKPNNQKIFLTNKKNKVIISKLLTLMNKK